MKGIKFEIFATSFPNSASDSLNEWIEEHPNVEIVDFRYQQARMGDHSICVAYKEAEKEETNELYVQRMQE